jgi:large subunit ribosomal protein L24
MSISKIQSGDKVKVISGGYKGSVGIVKKVFIKEGKITRVSISGLPKITKFRKAATYNGEKYPGMQTFIDRKVNITNVSLLTEDDKLSKVKVVFEGEKKVRTFKKNNQPVTKQAIPEELSTTSN